MDLIQIQTSDLTVGQQLPWDLFDKENNQVQKSGYVIKTAEELKTLLELSIYRKQIPEPEQPQPQSQIEEKKSKEFNFEDMQLKVGHKLQLKLHSHSKETSGKANNNFFTSTLFGYVENNTLIVSMPASNNLTGEPFIEGDQILVRIFSGQCVFSFSVFVEKVIKLPFKYLHLSFPKHILGQVVRKSRRIKCKILASVSEESIPLTIINLSATGAQISTTTPLGEPGTEIILSFTIKILDKEIAMSVKSMIRSTRPANKYSPETLNVGIEFTELEPDQIFSLNSLIYHRIVENPACEV
jgi:Flagellar protein YcgR/PilZ domain